MERGLVAESTSFTQYKRGVRIGENENEKERERETEREREGRKGRKEENRRGWKMENRRKARDTRFRMSGCLSVRLNLGVHQQPPTKEELGR